MRIKKYLILLLCIEFCFLSDFAFADPIFRVNDSTSQYIDKFSTCKKVTNASGKDIMVPAKVTGEWSAFLAHLPTGITTADCAPYYVNTNWKISLGGSTSCVLPSVGCQVGDLIIIEVYADNNMSTVTPPSGFAQISAPLPQTSPYYTWVVSKIATAADVAAANFTFTMPTTFGDCGAHMIVYRNVNQTTPIQAVDQSSNIPASTTITFGNVTTTNAYSTVIAMGDGASSAPGNPTAAGFTSRANNGSYGGRVSDKIYATPGATGVITATTTNQITGGRLIVVNPP